MSTAKWTRKAIFLSKNDFFNKNNAVGKVETIKII